MFCREKNHKDKFFSFGLKAAGHLAQRTIIFSSENEEEESKSILVNLKIANGVYGNDKLTPSKIVCLLPLMEGL